MEKLRNCSDCGVKPVEIHSVNCDVEYCSVCGGQRFGCDCKDHDCGFARWTRFWPGDLESKFLGIDLNDFILKWFHKIFFVTPKEKYKEIANE